MNSEVHAAEKKLTEMKQKNIRMGLHIKTEFREGIGRERALTVSSAPRSEKLGELKQRGGNPSYPFAVVLFQPP